MRVGLLSSWNTRCGIAEYSRHLALALRRQPDLDLTVFGSRNFGERDLAPFEEWAVPAFDIQPWHPERLLGLDVETILDRDLDALVVQYSNLFYSRRRLVRLMRAFPGVVALTYHDKCVSRAFPYRLPDLLYAHREDVGKGPRRFIPQGIDLRAPVVKTFGLGKSRVDIIGEVCARNGWDFQYSFGEDRWLTSEELFAWLRDSDAIVLWYDEDLSSGGSAGAPLAIGTRRPVFVNDTEWFSDLPEQTPNLRKLHTPEQLEHALREQFSNPYADARTWDTVAETIAGDLSAAIAEGDGPRRHRSDRVRGALFSLLDFKPYSLRKQRLLRRLGRGE